MQPTNINVIAALIAATFAGSVSASDTDATSSVKRARFLVLDSRIVDNSASGMTLQQRRETRYRPPRGREMAICYAVSQDGIKWEKPELGQARAPGRQDRERRLLEMDKG